MKKTVHINLAGHAFSIDEDAYERLDAYLQAVEAKLGNHEEAQETLEDINLRIAELFRGVHSDASSAITINDVEEIIKTLGDPGDYETPDDPEETTQERTTFEPPYKKQLFRDPDNRVLGGVCSGLGNYFGLDPILFRLLFVLATILYGTSFLAYLVLWIAIPKAVTVQQRIMMTGGNRSSESWRRRQTNRPVTTSSGNGVLRAIAVVFGIFLILASFVSLTGLIITFTMTDVLFGLFPGDEIWIGQLDALFLMPDQRFTAFLGLALTAGIPLLVLFYLGMYLIFQFKKGGPAFLVTALILWLAGIGLVVYTALNVASEFSNRESLEETTLLDLYPSDTIYIDANKSSLPLGKGDFLFSHKGLSVRKVDNQLNLIGTPDINVTKNADAFEISIRKQARGKTGETALENASAIEFFYLQDDSVLMLDRYFSIQKPALIRNQKVIVDINLPEGKELKVADDLKYIVNVSNEEKSF
ncbi:PspC domain-containing protein [Marinilabilia salmonicolor]|uniref:PspC domain-containing protein n=1 Tax=Marinilabilia salmonicolor TaxID=989 RepID=UPI00029A61FA|nr:PspC domain-containing protein [Marinilabilia salmonicolor]